MFKWAWKDIQRAASTRPGILKTKEIGQIHHTNNAIDLIKTIKKKNSDKINSINQPTFW